MSDVNEELVRIYFEQRGFLVLSNKLYVVKKEKGTGKGDIDLLVYNPNTEERAIIQVKGWHTTVMTKSMLMSKEKEIFSSLLSEGVINCAREVFGSGKFKKILVISPFSKKDKTRKEAEEFIKSKGIDEVITFPEIFEFLIKKIEPNTYFKHSEILFVIGKLKLYGFLKND